MKPFLFTILLLITFSCQSQQGLRVKYAEKIDLTEKLKAIENPLIRQMVIQKAGGAKHYTLTSNGGISIYENAKEKENNNSNITVIGTGGSDIIYKNLKNKEYLRQTDFMSRTFLIEDNLETNDWIISNETTKIGDYNCKKATLKNKKNIVVWFTMEIPSNEGPRDFYGLPGLILKVITGTKIIEAIDITLLKTVPKLEKPSKGKRINRADFEKIRQEKIQRLTGGKATKGNGVQIIKM